MDKRYKIQIKFKHDTVKQSSEKFRNKENNKGCKVCFGKYNQNK